MESGIPRLTLDELDAELAAALRPRVERLGYLGEFFRVVGWQPKALLDFYRLTEDLKVALSANYTEAVALTVASVAGNAYERNQHERLARTLGFSDAWIRACGSGDREAGAAFDETERIVARYARAAAIGLGRDTATERDALVSAIGHERAVAVMMLVGRYAMHAILVNTLGLEPPVASIFEEAT